MKKLALLVLLSCLFFVYSGTADAAAKSKDLIIINKKTNQLAFYQKGTFKKSFRVGTGRQATYTPEGTFKVVKKIVNRPYYKGNIKGGDPRNPLGKRWLGLNARNTPGNTYGIHGNNNPSSIGHYVSAGCVRMYNNEVEWLYDRVALNTTVIITTSSNTFSKIAASKGYTVKGNPASVPAVKGSTVLKKGSKGPEVKALQQALYKKGYNPNGIDGVFGPGTEKAVKKFQKAKKVTADGIVGAVTKKLLGI